MTTPPDRVEPLRHEQARHEPVRVERRVGQRFPYLLPVSIRMPHAGVEGLGFTQDVSSRGVFFFTDAPLAEGAEIELTLTMPSEITLGEKMRVRCRGRILRVSRPAAGHDAGPTPDLTRDLRKTSEIRAQAKIGVAVRFDGYEYLTESAEPASSFARVSALHPQPGAEKARAHLSGRPVQD